MFRLAIAIPVSVIGAFVAATGAFAQSSNTVSKADPGIEALVATGQRIYREGITGDGSPLKGLAAAQVVLTGKPAACAACHRRSGFGTSEGQYAIRPITGPALFEEETLVVRNPRIKAQLGTRQRPPYTDALLARAIRGGIDSSGQPLESVMPRYALSEGDLKAVSAYLATLSAKPSPGVDKEEIHFATVIQPDVAPARRRAMLDGMQAFFKDKASNVRSDEQRRDAGVMRMYRAYRKWVLHVWELKGSSETWRDQLEAFYRDQPVFALIGGLGDANWQPIHEFSERNEIPSVFPQIDLPAVTGDNVYNFYLSRGVALEAEVLAKFIGDKDASAKVLQIYRRSNAGLTASRAFKNALPSSVKLEQRELDGSSDAAFWSSVAAMKPDALVLWLGEEDLAGMSASAKFETSLPVYVSFDLLGGKLPPSALNLGGNIRVVYPSDLPPKHQARLLRSKIWLHSKNLPIFDETLQINTQFAMTVVSDAVGHIQDSFSRDYFAERVEHVVSQTPTPSIYQSVSLGPGQRFAAKGSSVVQVLDSEKGTLKALSGWIVP